jgi:RNA polymerase sigma-70 factor, ECF subfamily
LESPLDREDVGRAAVVSRPPSSTKRERREEKGRLAKLLTSGVARSSFPLTTIDMERTIQLRFAPPVLTEPAPADDGLAKRLRAAAAGDEDAFARLYHDYRGMVHAILLARVRRCDVDDLIQEVFVAAFRRLATLREPGAFGGWLAAIARNRATDHLRHGREEVELPRHLPGGTQVDPAALEALDAIRKLPDAYRETLLMRLVEGMSGAEIAERTGLTPASVRVNLHRGMKQLRQMLGWNSRE